MRYLALMSGLFIFTKNIYLWYFSKRRQFVFWGHLGLGDQICTAKLLEYWVAAGAEVHVPCKTKNIHNLASMFSYLDGVRFHPISNDPKKERAEVRGLARRLGLPVVNSGRSCLTFVERMNPAEGLNVCLMAGAGFRTSGLCSPRFRDHVLSLQQINPPANPYLFFHERTSTGTIKIPDWAKQHVDLISVTESPKKELFRHAKLLDNATQLHSVGSAFICLALVMGSRARVKTTWGDLSLRTDDPEGEWKRGVVGD